MPRWKYSHRSGVQAVVVRRVAPDLEVPDLPSPFVFDEILAR